MSPKNSLLATGLTALGLFGLAVLGNAEPETAPSGLPTSVAPNSSRAVLLLTNGTVIQGTISEDRKAYYLHANGGKIPYPKGRIEQSFKTLEDAYQYKLARLPQRDTDEAMKLARWCLVNNLNPQAKDQLKLVLSLSPNHREAAHMLEKIEGVEYRGADRDTGVVQAGGEAVEGRDDQLDPAVLGRAAREMGISTLPQIPGLTTAQSVKRMQEFRGVVHDILQKRCARCHDEQYQGEFRLVEVKTRRDMSSDTLRANLDAALRYIDFQEPAKSELLSSTLRPHGPKSNKRPIFTGSNDRAYQILAAWAARLRPTQVSGPTQPARLAPRAVEGEEGFAVQRAGAELPPRDMASASRPAEEEVPEAFPSPPGQFLPGSGTDMQPYAPEGTEFPKSPLMGGPKPRIGATAAPVMTPVPSAPRAAGQAPRAAALPSLPPGTQGPVGGEDERDAPAPKPAKKKAPVKLDPALLEKALMNRFAPQP